VQFRVLSRGPGNDWSARYAAGTLPGRCGVPAQFGKGK